jgi:glucose-fructose oxidoreductase
MLLRHSKNKIRYAVVGLGHIAQRAVLPAFAKAHENSLLAALVSGHREKLDALGDTYQVDKRYLYSEFEECLKRKEVDAVYLCTPNEHHRHLAETAARYGVHVLCEKPLALSAKDCVSMMKTAKDHGIKLMVAYRLYFEPANQRVIQLAQSKTIGEPRIFSSHFTIQVKDPENIRLQEIDRGGGPLYDIGIYCINTARNIFRSEPIEVYAKPSTTKESRFKKIDETVSCILKFPEGKSATFTVSFGTFPSGDFDLIGTKGRLRLEKAYNFDTSKILRVYEEGRTILKRYHRRDHFAPEIMHFSDCIQKNKTPLASAFEGLIDVEIIEALLLSMDLDSPITLDEVHRRSRAQRENESPRPLSLKEKFFNSSPLGGHKH